MSLLFHVLGKETKPFNGSVWIFMVSYVLIFRTENLTRIVFNFLIWKFIEEKFEDVQEVIRSRKSTDNANSYFIFGSCRRSQFKNKT